MKQYLTATAALLVVGAQAQLSGPNRPGPGTSPGTFQTPGSTESSIQVTTPDTANIRVAPPIANPSSGTVPRTTLGTPDARGGALSDSLGSRSSFPSSRDWETGTPGGRAATQSESRRLTPVPGDAGASSSTDLSTIDGARNAVRGTGSTGTTIPNSTSAAQAASGTAAEPALPTDLNTSGINTPPRASEQPLDKALSAKIRAQLSETPAKGMARLSPETVRDLRITSQGGKVILEGKVGSPSDRQLVEASARRVPGVVAVENRLAVNNRSVGAPATGQTGQSRQNASDLNEEHSATSPDIK